MFTKRIKQLREERQIPQRKMAAVLDIDTATYCKYEKGERCPKREQVVIIAQLRLGFFLVRPAWVYSNGCKSLTHPDSGKCLAKAKGVPREMESEGRWRQTSGLTYRNRI